MKVTSYQHLQYSRSTSARIQFLNKNTLLKQLSYNSFNYILKYSFYRYVVSFFADHCYNHVIDSKPDKSTPKTVGIFRQRHETEHSQMSLPRQSITQNIVISRQYHTSNSILLALVQLLGY